MPTNKSILSTRKTAENVHNGVKHRGSGVLVPNGICGWLETTKRDVPVVPSSINGTRPSMKLVLYLLVGAIHHFTICSGRPEIELTKELVSKHKCPFLVASGTFTDLIQNLASSQELNVPVLQVLQDENTVNYLKHRECQVVFMRSEPGLQLQKVEQLTHGSSDSLIAITGRDPAEVESRNATRTVIYFEERVGSAIGYVHILCPHLYTKGVWHERVGYWNRDRDRFRSLFPLLDYCPYALIGASVNVAWAISQGVLSVLFFSPNPTFFNS